MKKIIALVFVGAIALTGSSCTVDPCLKVPPPSPELVKIAQDPRIEVDYVISDKIECDMVGNGWQREQ